MNKINVSPQTRKIIFAEDSIIACSIYFLVSFKTRESRKVIFPCTTITPIFYHSSPKISFWVTSIRQKMIPWGIILREAKIQYHLFVVDGLKYNSITLSS